MIKFFRKIRQNLLMENKTSKYFKYAIGEIVLVVIGILIALQINNWKQEQNRASQEHRLLKSLQSDFVESKKRLKQNMFQQKRSIKECVALIEMYEGSRPMLSNDSIKIYLQYGAYSWYRPELVTGAFEALINTGDSELIKNDSLTKLMTEYFSISMAKFEDQETSMNHMYRMQEIAETTLLTLIPTNLKSKIELNLINASNENEAISFLFKQDAFFNHLAQKTILENLRYSIQEDLLVRIEQIIRIIDKEIQQFND